MAKDQEGSETQEFINEFLRMSDEKILRGYEEKHRNRIAEAPFEVKGRFDEVWKKVTGKPYFQPVTSTPVVVAHSGRNNTEVSDPKSCNYREMRPFKKIRWTKQRQRIGKRLHPRYTIYGTDADTNTQRQLYVNLSEEAVIRIFGEPGREILNSKDGDGTLKGDFELSVEGYWEVIFTPKKDPNDTIDVQLLWEGQCLVIQRMKPVILPGFYIEAADNATRAQYIQTPEDSRKIVSYIQLYPYTVRRRSTYEEYVKMKREGDRIQAEARKRKEEAE